MTVFAAGGGGGSNSYGTMTSLTGPLYTDSGMQAIATVPVTANAGGLNVASYTVAISGTVAGGNVTAVQVSDGSNTWSATGSYGNGSSVVCSGTAAKPGAVLTISVTLASAAATRTVAVTLSTDSNGAATLPQGPSTARTISLPPASNTYGTMTSMAGPLTANLTQQTVATVPATQNNGGLSVSSYTVNLTGTVTAGDVTGVYVTDGTSTWSTTGSYGNGSSVVCSGANAKPGATLSIKVTLAASADAKTVAVTLNTDSNAAASLPKGPSNALSISAPAGPSNTLADCAGCHNYPPVDSATRNTTTGNFIGDHDKHNVYTCATCHVAPATTTSIDFAHRTGQLNMDSGNIGVGADNGTYSKGASFNQVNNPAAGTCSLVDCHNNAVTPQWGVGTTACSSCHALPPATNAHSKHYTAKGWATGVTTNCTVCHPNNAAGHSDVTDGNVLLNASLNPGGISPARTCGATPTGCHNGQATPAWNTTSIACTSCHTVGGAGANPNTGLHNVTAAGVQKHDGTLTGGCTACHNATKPATHANGTFTADDAANTDRFISRTNMTWADGAANSGSCSGTGLTGCHSDSGGWTRLWSTAANSTVTTAGDARCNVCHGQFSNWRAGTSHGATFNTTASTRGSTHNNLTGAANACEDCHSYPSLSNHENGSVTMNEGAWVATRVTGTTYCSGCHTNDGAYTTSGTHTFKTSLFAKQSVAGANDPSGSCTGCHGGGTTGATSKNMWPDGSTANTANQAGRHVKHMTVLAARAFGLTLTGLLDDAASDTKQKQLCDYCHRASTNDADHMNTLPADVFPSGYAKMMNNTAAGVADSATVASYSAAADTCSNVDCHNNKLTTDGTFGWYDAGTSTCMLCHSLGGTNNPTSGLHNVVPTVSGTTHDDSFGTGGTCTSCHTAMPAYGTTSTHINATFTTNDTTATNEYYTFVGYTDAAANAGTCAGGTVGGASCHAGSDAGTWARKWSTTAANTDGTQCANCHGGLNETDWTFGGTANTTDGTVEHNRNWDGDASTGEVIGNHSGTTQTTACVTCHVYGNAAYVWGTHHRNGSIEMNSSLGYSGTTFNCTSTCHANNTGHNLEDSGWTVANLAGPAPACIACHTGSGTQQYKVGPTSSHTDPDGSGATYAAGAGHCEVCHFASHATRTTNTVAITWDTRTMGTNYTADGKIYLKSNIGGTAVTTEAEVCWRCHWGLSVPSQSPLIKEFGGATVQGAYTPGSLSQGNWVGATWTSANFGYKTNPIASIHQAMGATIVDPTIITTAPAAAQVATIGCTSCHDVHRVGNNGFTPAGQPYLRGSWTSNPFKEDGAPLTGMTFSGDRGAVPRGILTAASNGIGGWQIEQNNASFTNVTYAGATGFAGLCANCHTQAKLEGMAWSGHKGTVSGFTGNTANDILQDTKRGGTNAWTRGYMSYNAVTTGRSGSWVGGLRNTRQFGDGILPGVGISPQLPVNPTYPAGTVKTIVSPTGYQNDFHNFPCSKCHSPHASRLPRLMITNCLDVKHNTWDNAYNPSAWAAADTHLAKQLAYSSTAQNCHRYVLSTDGNKENGSTGENGWNAVTPW